jgi:hypothetical protein
VAERRNSSSNKTMLATLGVIGLATSAAFATGAHLRDRYADRLLGGGVAAGSAASPRQLAQAAVDDNGAAGGRIPGPARLSLGGADGADGKADNTNGVTTESQLRTFSEVLATVQQEYVDALPSQTKMSQGAVRAMIAELNDPNARYLEPAERAAWEAQRQRGEWSGIGAALRFAVKSATAIPNTRSRSPRFCRARPPRAPACAPATLSRPWMASTF